MYSNCTHISNSCSFDYTVISFSIFFHFIVLSSLFMFLAWFSCHFVMAFILLWIRWSVCCFFSPHFQFLQMLGFRFFSVSHSPDFDWVLCRQCIYFNEDYSCPSSVFHLFWILIRTDPPKRLKFLASDDCCLWSKYIVILNSYVNL